MARTKQEEMIVALDIGTSKVVAIVGEINVDDEVEVIGIGTHRSSGLKKGVVINIESTVESIKRAVQEAELMADCDVFGVYAGIAGNHIKSFNSHGMAAIRDKHEVTKADVDDALQAAKAMQIPENQKLLHMLPQEFIIDQQEGIREPIGMAGVRLETKVHLVTAAESAMHNIEKCIRQSGLDIDGIILEQLASSYAVLTEDEKELGVCMVDIGGGTADISVYTEGAIQHTAVIPIAGDQVTNDIAKLMHTPTKHAEEIKIKYGCAKLNMTNDDESLEVVKLDESGTQTMSRQSLVAIIEPRYEEIFEFVRDELEAKKYIDTLGAGVVLTGGSSKLEGVVELAEEVFAMPARVGRPHKIKGLSEVVSNPMHATGVGLLMFGHEQRQKGILAGSDRGKTGGGLFAGLKSLINKF